MPRQSPLRVRSASSSVADPPDALTRAGLEGMALVPEGEFMMGSEDRLAYPNDGEGPVRKVRLSPFWIDACAVTNAEFTRFVDDSGYMTEAERLGRSFVFSGLLPDDARPARGVGAPWWRQVEGADWRHPEGPSSDLEGREDHPAVHVTWNDAYAYATAQGKRLPTEAEWEYAARGGLEGEPYPWGSDLQPGGRHMMNVWQGRFPRLNTCEDGYLATCPVDEYEPNAYGLYNMTGNTWEWVADWFSRTFHQADRHTNPRGPQAGTHKAVRGGSYLCHASYSRRYRVSARAGLTPDWACGDVGFRCSSSLRTG
jgi:formylglycine-generating enzyme